MKRWYLVIVVGLVVMLNGVVVFALQSSSTNYGVNEVQFGPGGLLNATSSHYKAQQSLGSTGVGPLNSAHYGANAGFLTPNVPFLEMVVNSATINLGALSSASTATGTGTFHVRAYVDSGYTVLTMNDPPVQEEGTHLTGLSSPTAPSTGTEQFGMNLVHNISGCGIAIAGSADPVQVPSSAFATGAAATGYNTCGLFKYVKGDTVAQSTTQGWGETDYTISYIVNISSITRAGTYNMAEDLVAVTTF